LTETKKQPSNSSSKHISGFYSNLGFKCLLRLAGVLAGVGVFLCFFPPTLQAEVSEDRLQQLQKHLQEDPEDKETLLALALEYSVQKQFKKAVETYFALLKIDPNNFHAYNNLGILYKKTGQFKDSLYCYQQALKLNPESYWVPYNMGLAYEAMGRMQEAREAYGKALSLNPDFSLALQRLRELSEEPGKLAPLPEPPGSKIYLVDAPGAQPRLVDGVGKTSEGKPGDKTEDKPEGKPEGKPGEPAKETPKTESGKTPTKETPSEKNQEKIAEKTAEKSPGKTPKKQAQIASELVRTARAGPGASLFNQAMDSLDKEDLPKAIEMYVRCVLTERDFLAEPDNGLIQKALTYLRERPNSMKEGMFFRAFFSAITGNLASAVPDLKVYVDQNAGKKGAERVFLAEAQSLIDRHGRELAEAAALKASQASEAAIIAEARIASQRVASEAASFTPRLDDLALKQMDVDAIIDEANRLSRDARIRDAIAVLQVGLEKEPENVRLLMAMGNAYTDLMFLKGDNEAGRMAREIFSRVVRLSPAGSKEATLSLNFINELDNRLK